MKSSSIIQTLVLLTLQWLNFCDSIQRGGAELVQVLTFNFSKPEPQLMQFGLMAWGSGLIWKGKEEYEKIE